MERMPFIYVALTLGIGLLILCAWVAAYFYYRSRPSTLSTKDKVLGFMLAGPFFFALHSSLSSRNYKLTLFERLGLALVVGVVIVIVVGGVIHGYVRT